MTALLVKLATTPVQALQGFTDVHPLSARSVAAVPPPPSAAPLLPAVNKWLNVPFATAARWSRPTAYVAPSAEEGAVRKCFEFGATPLQGPGAVEPLWTCKDGWLDRDFVGEDEDCLSLNVFVPKEASEQAAREGRQLPVMVWVYGGALATGHATAIRHDPTELVRIAEAEGRPVIVVTGNYRLNIFGFLTHPDLAEADPEGLCGNYGFYDQIKMFEWVQQHIEQFGGSPSRVTAFGESAGAFSISVLAARRDRSPVSLFQRAILQSGSPSTMSFKAPSYSPWSALLKHAGMDDPSLTAAQRVAGLRALPAVDLLDFAVKNGVLGGWGGTLQPGGMFEIHPELSFRDGDWDRGVKEWVLGSCEDEGALFVRALPGKMGTNEGFSAYLDRSPDVVVLKSLYPSPSSDVPLPSAPASHLLADQLFLVPLHSLALSLTSCTSPATIKVYKFRAPLPKMSESYGIGVHHAIEIPFVFGTRTFWEEGSDEEKTSEECMRRWSSFAVDGVGKGSGPDWENWTKVDPKQLILGPRGGGSKLERIVMSELETARQDYWLRRIRGGGPTGLGS